jgi:hypothetical protein
MKCPKCGGELTTCLCCDAKTLCRKCKACFGYKPAPAITPAHLTVSRPASRLTQ